MTDKNKKAKNFLDFIPVQNIQWALNEKGKVYLIKEKTKNKVLKKVIRFVNKSQDFRIHLDEYGTATWLAIDGVRTVLQIAQELKKQFGEAFTQPEERVAYYIGMMKKDNFVHLLEPQEETEDKKEEEKEEETK